MTLKEKDEKFIWHPYTSLKSEIEHIPIIKAQGVYLYDDKGNEYIDAVSSWWVTIHGHAHPYLAQKTFEQFNTLEHTIFAGFTHPKAVELSERILKLLPTNQSKVFFSDNGSTAVEVALKMAVQYWYNQGEKRNKIIAIEGAYHGDTFGAMSVSGRGAFNAPFNDMLFDVEYISFPSDVEKTKSELQGILASNNVAAFIFEPLVQGAGGMRMYSSETLDELIRVCQDNQVLCIADEVMTGFGRTGKMFAADYLNTQPDIFCLSKGLTGGSMPMSLTTCSNKVVEPFITNDKLKTLFHGHSFTANALGCAVSCASLDLFENEETWEQIDMINQEHTEFQNVLKHNKSVQNVRVLGTILAFEVITGESNTYFNTKRDELYNYFINKRVLLRPLGNTLYILPPYCISKKDLKKVYSTIFELVQGL